jgi:hypothetical protein
MNGLLFGDNLRWLHRLIISIGLALSIGVLDTLADDNTPSQDITNRCDATIYKGARIMSHDDCKAEIMVSGRDSIGLDQLPSARVSKIAKLRSKEMQAIRTRISTRSRRQPVVSVARIRA